jgi:hypothetical protein
VKIERDYLSLYRLLFGRLAARSKSFTVEEAVTIAKSWFHGRNRRSLVASGSADIIDNTDGAGYIDLKWFLLNAPWVDVIITTRSSRARG